MKKLLQPLPLSLAFSLSITAAVWAKVPYEGYFETGPKHAPIRIFTDLSDLAEVPPPPSVDYWAALTPPEAPVPLVSLPLPVSRPMQALLEPPKPLAREALLSVAEKSVGSTARQLGLHRLTLWCAAAINAWAKKIGVKGTNSDLAKSFAGWGVASPEPCVGCVAIKYRRGGQHVAIVKRVVGNRVIVVSPNGGNGKVRIATYPVKVFYAFREPKA